MRSSSISIGIARHVAARLVEPQRHRHGHPAHRADLQVEDAEVVSPPALSRRATCSDTSRPSLHTVNDVSGPPSAASDVVDEPLGVGGDQDVHVRNVMAGAIRIVLSSQMHRFGAPGLQNGDRGRRRGGGRRGRGRRVSWTSDASSGTSTTASSEKRAANGTNSSSSAASARRAARRASPTARAVVSSPTAPRARPACRPSSAGSAANDGVHAVGDTPRQPGHPLAVELVGEPHRLLDRLVVRRRHHHEAGAVGPQQRRRPPAARWLEPALHAGERLEERHGVGEHVGARPPCR